MPSTNESYASYLLRFQRVQRDDGRAWMASVQSTATGELRRFANLEALVHFLRDEFGECAQTRDASQEAAQDMPGPGRERKVPSPTRLD